MIDFLYRSQSYQNSAAEPCFAFQPFLAGMVKRRFWGLLSAAKVGDFVSVMIGYLIAARVPPFGGISDSSRGGFFCPSAESAEPVHSG